MKMKRYIVAGSYLLCLFMIPFLSGYQKDSPTTTDKKIDLGTVPRENWMGQLDSAYSGLSLGK